MPRKAPAPQTSSAPRHIAFLRAINVGGHTVSMARLRALFAALKLAHVETFIASGNVIFDAPGGDSRELENRIERHLKKALGYDVLTMVRSAAEVSAVAAWEPFTARERQGPKVTLFVAFLKDAPAKDAAGRLMAIESPADLFRVRGRELYWLLRGGFSDSKFAGGAIEKMLGVRATVRNITTVRKLAAKYGGVAGV
jgi:uncharacterized protein (DUF1697 family)